MQSVENAEVNVILLPPYFADFNPLELVFGKVKAFLKERITSFYSGV